MLHTIWWIQNNSFFRQKSGLYLQLKLGSDGSAVKRNTYSTPQLENTYIIIL